LRGTAYLQNEDTIVALATPQGAGAIAVIRLSGKGAIHLANLVFKGKNLEKEASHTVHFGTIRTDEGKIVDEVLATIFVAPRSFTRENVVEFSCHGSSFIVKEILKLLIKKGARPARAGEFTRRAFLNGQFDLAQAEAVADLINADSEAAHQAALHQMRGGFSDEIRQLREQLIHFASMIELELDFGEEDVEFASRDDLRKLIEALQRVISRLLASFEVGNVIKNGVPTVIAGKPNAGKSTLLNTLLNEEKAIVSEIAGTTRDFIEDEIIISGVQFRFIDTAGLRDTTDTIESIGVQRTREKLTQASLILYLFDLTTESADEIGREINMLENLGKPFIAIGNKVDEAAPSLLEALKGFEHIVYISARQKTGIEELKEKVLAAVNLDSFRTGNTVVTTARHYDSLTKTHAALQDVINGIEGEITNDFLALDIRNSLYHLGEITGEITTDDLLANIFSKFCIGK
jgi:tRNA modification GTPase